MAKQQAKSPSKEVFDCDFGDDGIMRDYEEEFSAGLVTVSKP
jgi:hypothetical protein